MSAISPIKPIILAREKWWIVLGKPAGWVTESHPDHPSLQEWLREQLNTKREPFVGVVHRLDRVTTGVVIFALRPAALKHLNQQFQGRSVQKTYVGLVQGDWKKDKGVMRHFIGKESPVKATISMGESLGFRNSVTHYQVIQRNVDSTLVRLKPVTGRFHQLRIQCAHEGHPIIGDTLYGGEIPSKGLGVALHASSLSFRDPVTEGQRKVTCPSTINHLLDGFLS